MSPLHGRWRRRVSLLALEALSGSERARTAAHAQACPRCRPELEEARAALALLGQDPAGSQDLPIPQGALLARVQAELDAAAVTPRTRFSLAAVWSAAGVAASVLVVWALTRGAGMPPAPEAADAEHAVLVSEDALERLERRVSREQTARYLNEAQDVLVTVAATVRDCDKQDEHVDVAEESRRSRELLARRALLVDVGHEAVASARPVIEDVDLMLHEVAALPSCARPDEVAAIRREVARRRLLLKIDLMTRELQG